jgi:hypothetical protein
MSTLETMNENPAEQPFTDEQLSFIDKLVEKKGSEVFRDPEQVAKSALAATEHIENLERQIKEQAEDMSQMMRKEAVEALVAEKAKELAVELAPGEVRTDPDPSKIESLVGDLLSKREQEATYASNTAQADKFLEETFGTEAEQAVKDQAAKLGLTLEQMKQTAATSPSAFARLMDKPVPSTNQTPASQINAEHISATGDRNYAYYQKLRKENPAQYYTPAVQKQLGEDRNRLGQEKFYN